MKQNVEIYLADSTPCTRIALHGISITDFFLFLGNLVIPIGMAKYCVKIGRIPPKSEWLAAMHFKVTGSSYYSEALPAQARAKIKVLRRFSVNLTQSNVISRSTSRKVTTTQNHLNKTLFNF